MRYWIDEFVGKVALVCEIFLERCHKKLRIYKFEVIFLPQLLLKVRWSASLNLLERIIEC